MSTLTIRAAGTLDLTVHRRDPDIPRMIRVPERQGKRARFVPIAMEADGHDGATICGLRLLLEDLWVEHEPEPNDPRCRVCFADELSEPADEDDPELWPGEDDDAEFEDEPERRVETVKVVGGLL